MSKAVKSKEREFMHDIATPIGIAMGCIEAMLDLPDENEPLSNLQKERLTRARKALERVRDMMTKRREEILRADEVK